MLECKNMAFNRENIKKPRPKYFLCPYPQSKPLTEEDNDMHGRKSSRLRERVSKIKTHVHNPPNISYEDISVGTYDDYDLCFPAHGNYMTEDDCKLLKEADTQTQILGEPSFTVMHPQIDHVPQLLVTELTETEVATAFVDIPDSYTSAAMRSRPFLPDETLNQNGKCCTCENNKVDPSKEIQIHEVIEDNSPGIDSKKKYWVNKKDQAQSTRSNISLQRTRVPNTFLSQRNQCTSSTPKQLNQVQCSLTEKTISERDRSEPLRKKDESQYTVVTTPAMSQQEQSYSTSPVLFDQYSQKGEIRLPSFPRSSQNNNRLSTHVKQSSPSQINPSIYIERDRNNRMQSRFSVQQDQLESLSKRQRQRLIYNKQLGNSSANSICRENSNYSYNSVDAPADVKSAAWQTPPPTADAAVQISTVINCSRHSSKQTFLRHSKRSPMPLINQSNRLRTILVSNFSPAINASTSPDNISLCNNTYNSRDQHAVREICIPEQDNKRDRTTSYEALITSAGTNSVTKPCCRHVLLDSKKEQAILTINDVACNTETVKQLIDASCNTLRRHKQISAANSPIKSNLKEYCGVQTSIPKLFSAAVSYCDPTMTDTTCGSGIIVPDSEIINIQRDACTDINYVQPSKEPSKELSKESSKEPSKEPSKQTSKQPSKENSNQPLNYDLSTKKDSLNVLRVDTVPKIDCSTSCTQFKGCSAATSPIQIPNCLSDYMRATNSTSLGPTSKDSMCCGPCSENNMTARAKKSTESKKSTETTNSTEITKSTQDHERKPKKSHKKKWFEKCKKRKGSSEKCPVCSKRRECIKNTDSEKYHEKNKKRDRMTETTCECSNSAYRETECTCAKSKDPKVNRESSHQCMCSTGKHVDAGTGMESYDKIADDKPVCCIPNTCGSEPGKDCGGVPGIGCGSAQATISGAPTMMEAQMNENQKHTNSIEVQAEPINDPENYNPYENSIPDKFVSTPTQTNMNESQNTTNSIRNQDRTVNNKMNENQYAAPVQNKPVNNPMKNTQYVPSMQNKPTNNQINPPPIRNTKITNQNLTRNEAQQIMPNPDKPTKIKTTKEYKLKMTTVQTTNSNICCRMRCKSYPSMNVNNTMSKDQSDSSTSNTCCRMNKDRCSRGAQLNGTDQSNGNKPRTYLLSCDHTEPGDKRGKNKNNSSKKRSSGKVETSCKCEPKCDCLDCDSKNIDGKIITTATNTSNHSINTLSSLSASLINQVMSQEHNIINYESIGNSNKCEKLSEELLTENNYKTIPEKNEKYFKDEETQINAFTASTFSALTHRQRTKEIKNGSKSKLHNGKHKADKIEDTDTDSIISKNGYTLGRKMINSLSKIFLKSLSTISQFKEDHSLKDFMTKKSSISLNKKQKINKGIELKNNKMSKENIIYVMPKDSSTKFNKKNLKKCNKSNQRFDKLDEQKLYSKKGAQKTESSITVYTDDDYYQNINNKLSPNGINYQNKIMKNNHDVAHKRQYRDVTTQKNMILKKSLKGNTTKHKNRKHDCESKQSDSDNNLSNNRRKIRKSSNKIKQSNIVVSNSTIWYYDGNKSSHLQKKSREEFTKKKVIGVIDKCTPTTQNATTVMNNQTSFFNNNIQYNIPIKLIKPSNNGCRENRQQFFGPSPNLGGNVARITNSCQSDSCLQPQSLLSDSFQFYRHPKPMCLHILPPAKYIKNQNKNGQSTSPELTSDNRDLWKSTDKVDSQPRRYKVKERDLPYCQTSHTNGIPFSPSDVLCPYFHLAHPKLVRLKTVEISTSMSSHKQSPCTPCGPKFSSVLKYTDAQKAWSFPTNVSIEEKAETVYPSKDDLSTLLNDPSSNMTSSPTLNRRGIMHQPSNTTKIDHRELEKDASSIPKHQKLEPAKQTDSTGKTFDTILQHNSRSRQSLVRPNYVCDMLNRKYLSCQSSVMINSRQKLSLANQCIPMTHIQSSQAGIDSATYHNIPKICNNMGSFKTKQIRINSTNYQKEDNEKNNMELNLASKGMHFIRPKSSKNEIKNAQSYPILRTPSEKSSLMNFEESISPDKVISSSKSQSCRTFRLLDFSRLWKTENDSVDKCCKSSCYCTDDKSSEHQNVTSDISYTTKPVIEKKRGLLNCVYPENYTEKIIKRVDMDCTCVYPPGFDMSCTALDENSKCNCKNN